MRLYLSGVFLISFAFPVGAQTDQNVFERFCLPADAALDTPDLSSPMAALQAVNSILSTGDMLRLTGTSATFGDAWIGGPDFSIQAKHNDVIIMDRSFVMEGGNGCKAWKTDTGASERCNWQIVPTPPVDLNAEPSATAFMIWETLVLKADTLTLFSAMSGGRDLATKTYTCDDPAELLMFLRNTE